MKNINNESRRETYTPEAGLFVRKSADGLTDTRTIEGCAIRFNSLSAVLYADSEECIREEISRESVTQELLDRSDIKFTLFHDRQLLLARSKGGKGTLHYELREDGVYFTFDAPKTADGDKALELVRSGIIDGCSFAFSTQYNKREYVERTSTQKNGRLETVCRVRKMTGIYDMTLTPDPAYPSTSVKARELYKLTEDSDPVQEDEALKRQLEEMRSEGSRTIYQSKY